MSSDEQDRRCLCSYVRGNEVAVISIMQATQADQTKLCRRCVLVGFAVTALASVIATEGALIRDKRGDVGMNDLMPKLQAILDKAVETAWYIMDGVKDAPEVKTRKSAAYEAAEEANAFLAHVSRMARKGGGGGGGADSDK